MSTRRASYLFVSVLLFILLLLRGWVKIASPLDDKGAEKVLLEVQQAGYSLTENTERGRRFRNHLNDWSPYNMQQTRVNYYDVNAIQPNDTLPAFTMTFIEIAFKETGYAYEFVKAFNNSSPEMRNGNVAIMCFNVAYVSTKQMRFEEIMERVYPTIDVTGKGT